MSAVISKMETAWGDDAPDWVRVLAKECDARTQKAVADALGYSPAVVSTVIARTYKGDLNAVEQAVKGAFLNATVACPVAGELPAHRCLEFQRQPFAAANPQRVRMYRACRMGCVHARK